MSFTTGNIIYVYGEMDDDGFYMGELDGVRGLVPSNFLTEAPPEYNTGGMTTSQGKGSRGGPQRAPQDRDRGHGPGARGPPPPPRTDPRADRRKGILFVNSKLSFILDHFQIFSCCRMLPYLCCHCCRCCYRCSVVVVIDVLLNDLS